MSDPVRLRLEVRFQISAANVRDNPVPGNDHAEDPEEDQPDRDERVEHTRKEPADQDLHELTEDDQAWRS